MFSGFDLIEVGMDEVTLRTGKQANKRSIQFVLQALLALFGKFSTFLFLNKFFKVYVILFSILQTHKKHLKAFPCVHQVQWKV